MNITIRNETEKDHRDVEELTREAFWNLYVPGCSEHYLAHILRSHPDFIADLDFVAIADGRIAGNIMYTKSHLANDAGARLETVTFGPVSVLPQYQGKGIGSALIRHSVQQAAESGYKAVIIHGHPHNYCKHGFKSSRDFNVSDAGGRFPYSLLLLELEKGALHGSSWRYAASEVFNIDDAAAEEFDRRFPHKPKEYRYTQEEFRIACRAFLE